VGEHFTISRQDANAAFAHTSFLYGGNADYLEQLYARYEDDPQSIDSEWREFFASLKDSAGDVRKSARGPSRELPHGPALARNDLTSALDGDWGEVNKTIGDKVGTGLSPLSSPLWM
jgi:2-oxoglutarate dehydrogenase E1 component